MLNIDKTMPAIAGAPERGADANGWYNRPVEILWTCTDALSGIAACGPPTSYSGPDTTSTVITGSATDNAGNTATGSVTLRFDDTPPKILLRMPKNGAVYLLRQKVLASYTCGDKLSGVDTCTGPQESGAGLHAAEASMLNGQHDIDGGKGRESEPARQKRGDPQPPDLSRVDTSIVGSKEFRVNAVDVAGNEASVAHTYHVRYAFFGDFRPVDKRQMAEVVKAGRTIPLKWVLKDARGAFVRDLASFVSLVSAPIPCHTSSRAPLDDKDASSAKALRFAGGTWHYNWRTSKDWRGCRLVQLTLADGTRHYARFLFR
jgi:hypothetical protein